jgi:tetratricopeptide (TPR) repeat protein
MMRALLALVGLLTACASVPHVPPPAPVPPLVHGATGPEVDQLVEQFYGAGLSPREALERAESVLKKYPTSSRAHEVAGLAAMLLSDHDQIWRHFLAAATDLDSDASELYVNLLAWEPHALRAVNAGLLDELRRSHPRATVRAYATLELARIEESEGHFTAEEQLVSGLGVIRDWQLLGALDNDQGKGFLAVYPPEEKIDLAAEVAGPLVPLRWRKVDQLSRLGYVRLGDLLWPREFAVAYLATWVHSDSERQAQLRVATRSPVRAFVNDGLVLSEEQVADGDLDTLAAPISLHAGWNQILIKSAHRRNLWSLSARITDAEGNPLEGLRFSSAAQKFDKGGARDPATTIRVMPAFGGPEGRKSFLDSEMLVRAGLHRQALSSLQEMLDRTPQNPLAQFFGALAYWDNDELGKTIDLLNEGANKAQAFLLKRGRYYAQKQLWEKAQTDLLSVGPSSRSAKTELADLFERRGWQVDRCNVIKELLGRWPDDVWALRERSGCLESLGYNEIAEKLLVTAAAIEPGESATWSRLFDLARRRGDLTRARGMLEKILVIDPQSSSWRVELGELLRRMGDDAGARARFAEAAQLAPESPRPWERLGSLAWERGRRDEALEAWRKAHERDPNNSSLAQRIEFLAPTRLGFIEKYVPTEAEIDRACQLKLKAHPGAQAALLMDHEVTEVNADGSARRVVTQVAQAVDEKGRDGLTHERLPMQGQLKILRAYSLTDKGERQEASSIRGGEVRFRNLQIGSKTVVQYIHYMPQGHFLPNAFATQWYFQTVGRQHEDSTWVVVLPRGRKVHVEIVGPVDENRSNEGDREVRVFHAAHMPPLVQEAHMPPADDLLAQVAISTVENWDDYVRWERALLVDAFHSNSTLDALIDKLISGVKSPREKLDKLFHHVAQEVRYQQDYENTIAGVRPHGAPVVVERGYGDCKDKAVLLIQMARRAGLKLHFAILRTTPHGRVRREIPNQQFNHAIVYVPQQPGIDQPFFMDPTSDGLDMGNLRADDQGALALVMDPETGKWEFREIPYQTPELQYDHHKIRIELKSATEAAVADELSLRGSLAMGLRHVLRNEGEAKKLYETLAAALFPGSTLKDAKAGDKEDIWHPLAMSLELDGSQSIHPEEDHFRLTLPGTVHLQNAIALKKRETPLRLGAPDSASYDIETMLPDGFAVTHAPKDFSVEHACFTISRKSKVEGRRLTEKLQYSRRCTDVSVGEYVAFRDAVQAALHQFNDDLVFGRAKKK